MSGLRRSVCLLAVVVWCACISAAQRQRPQQQQPPAPPAATSPGQNAAPSPTPAAGEEKQGETTVAKGTLPAAQEKEPPEEKPVVTHHEMRAGGKALRYTVTTGMMPIRDAAGKLEANIFYMAYTLDNPGPGKRPLTFSFNGGPGSSSVWLHLGAIGPKRVKMQNEGFMPSPPFELVDNEYTWLDQTDLVFIDPVGTGYSRAVSPEVGKKFWQVRGDIESVGEFIRMYLVRNQRWTSPLFIVGESYGTFRAAGLSGYLVDRGIALNGVLLISTILNYGTHDPARMNDMPYALMLPSYTATAFYHKRLAPDLQQDLQKTLRQAEAFAVGDYAAALAKGDLLSPEERAAAAEKLARFTGLDKQYVDNSNLRVPLGMFLKELGRPERRSYGRLDSRFAGIDANAAGATPDFDPSLAAITPPYTSMFNNYVRSELGYKSDKTYYILGGGFSNWDFTKGFGRGEEGGQGYADTSELLRSAFAKNPYMKLFVASGYYDMATPYFATEYTLSHLSLDPSAQKNITRRYYEAGHMMYIHTEMLARLRKDVGAFLDAALR
ncbi:MAG TPA: peptidase S10 [Terriglobales bacterium]|nr:peptidase S10 [Terriglobales bacterium]